MRFTQEAFNTCMDLINKGAGPAASETADGSIHMSTLPDEEFNWIGKVHTHYNMFERLSSKYGAYGVRMGVSPYRIVFLLERGGLIGKTHYYCRSRWFWIDFEGQFWERGTIRKSNFTGYALGSPEYKKGLIDRQILIYNYATRSDGKEEGTFGCELSDIEWLNPETGKYEGRKADNVYDRLKRAFDSRQRTSVYAIYLLIANPDQLEEELYQPEEAAGEAVRAPVSEPHPAVPTPQVPVQMPPTRPTVTASPRARPLAPAPPPRTASATAPVAALDQAWTCIKCGHSNRAGARFCGRCGQTQEKMGGSIAEPGDKPSHKASAAERTDQAKTDTKAETRALSSSSPAKRDITLACSACGKPAESEWTICPYCGGSLEQRCPKCSAQIAADWKACAHCGAALE